VLGRRGQLLAELRTDTGTSINLSSFRDDDPTRDRTITIQGALHDTERARAILLDRAQLPPDHPTETNRSATRARDVAAAAPAAVAEDASAIVSAFASPSHARKREHGQRTPTPSETPPAKRAHRAHRPRERKDGDMSDTEDEGKEEKAADRADEVEVERRAAGSASLAPVIRFGRTPPRDDGQQRPAEGVAS